MSGKSLKITFILPQSGAKPIGGFKVVYEYANALAQKGHRVTVVHPAFLNLGTAIKIPGRIIRYAQWRFRGFRPDVWFSIRRDVQLIGRMSLDEKHIPDGDCVIATAWETAEWVGTYSSRKGRKFYFVQDYERYESATEDVRIRMRQTYNLDLYIAYISPVVRDMILECGGRPSLYLPNSVDFQIYQKTQSIASTDRNMIGFPVRSGAVKGTDDALKALEIVKSKYPDVKVWSFGMKAERQMPSWVEHHELPSDRELSALYNRTKIFVLPSHFEGWGLPGSEAMACGSALVTADNGGCHAYATDGVTALIAKRAMPQQLAEKVSRLMEDEDLRIRIATAGYHHIQKFTWDSSVKNFEAALMGETDLRPAR